MLKQTLLAGTVAAGLLAASSAQAVIVTNGGGTIFDSGGFEADTVGTNPSATNTGTWSVVESGSGVVGVENSPLTATEGSNYLSAANHATRAQGGFGPQNSGDISAAFRFWVGSEQQTALAADRAILISQSDTANGGNVAVFADRIIMAGFGPGSDAAHAGAIWYNGAYQNITTGGGASNMEITRNAWHDVNLDWTIGSTTFTMTIDGVESDPLLIQAGYETRTPASILFQSNFGQQEDWALDSIPEPASLALLGLGGLMVLRRRKH